MHSQQSNVVYLPSKLTPWRIARATRAALLPVQLCAAAWQMYWHAWALAWHYPESRNDEGAEQ